MKSKQMSTRKTGWQKNANAVTRSIHWRRAWVMNRWLLWIFSMVRRLPNH